MTNCFQLEDIGNAGNWNSFAKIIKQQPAMKSAWVDYVRISWIADETIGVAGAASGLGVLFAASPDSALDSNTPSNNDGYMISTSAMGTPGGVVTLPIKRRIVDDNADINSGESAVYLHCRSTDMNATVKVYLVIETYGRWHKTEAL